MPKRKSDDSKINLIPQKGFETTEGGRILLWLLSSFRIVVIVTEIVVMIAFLVRFGLYSQNTSLTSEVKQKQDYISSEASFEKDFRAIQTKLKIFTTIANTNNFMSNYLANISSHIPNDIVLKSVTYDQKKLSITATSPSEVSIAQFLANLQSVSELNSAAIEEIAPDVANISLLSFVISVPLSSNPTQ
ncbi:hypothetical protein A2115_02330 [Candidatus Woesebacteria bacterium GWA1_41_8]|jgi:Tfp pilus assembly protein PilN|uniref:Uncharacterized protein n=1 Tax=Candidatus Woesebacteria bacterium GWA1_41_8 TaxID=1802471 RepID=A0A1F7WLT1_9BACT|nr:MAG: hypothetical protein A2115_02330 [Candidatus Woesebacteria bacterium GWA1_41_8]